MLKRRVHDFHGGDGLQRYVATQGHWAPGKQLLVMPQEELTARLEEARAEERECMFTLAQVSVKVAAAHNKGYHAGLAAVQAAEEKPTSAMTITVTRIGSPIRRSRTKSREDAHSKSRTTRMI